VRGAPHEDRIAHRESEPAGRKGTFHVGRISARGV
jgi:hypothetical protein